MQNKKITVAIIGVGGRGGYAYGSLLSQLPHQFEIVALCDINEKKLQFFGEKFDIKAENLFSRLWLFWELYSRLFL
jgi:predicted dehydrogenase